VQAAESLVLDTDIWEYPTNSETALSMWLAVRTDISALVGIHPTAVMSSACQPITEQEAEQ
jgi:hypothetical protein